MMNSQEVLLTGNGKVYFLVVQSQKCVKGSEYDYVE